MSFFGLTVENNKQVDLFVEDMNNKLKSPDMFQNPFKGFIKKIGKKEPYLLIYLDLLWFNPIYPTIFLTIALFIASGFSLNFWFLILIPLWLGCFMFTKSFLVLATRFTLRKKGYEGKIKTLSNTELFFKLSKWDREK